MTPEAQRIAIAEACGWHIIEGEPPTGLNKNWTHSDFRFIPDYLNDLNAMHEAEKVLSAARQTEYSYQLEAVTCPKEYGWHATSAQRAEAFLRTLNLWTSA